MSHGGWWRGVISMLLAAICWMVSDSPAVRAEPRIALVIGNSAYGPALGKLDVPVNDARLMSDILKRLGFSVIELEDADQKQMKRTIAEFGDKLADAGSQSTGLFFYSGHALQVHGSNYIIPIGAQIQREADVDIESVSAETVIQQMEFAGSATNIVMIDASRNNPLQRGFRSISNGLGEFAAAEADLFISYSTTPGRLVRDGKGPHSFYVAALAATMETPGLGLHDLFDRVRAQVLATSGGKQLTWDSSGLTKPFYFVPAQ